MISSLIWTFKECVRVKSGMLFLLVEGRWEDVGHTHTQLVCAISWTHMFTLRRSLTQTHTQAHTRPNAHRLIALNQTCTCPHVSVRTQVTFMLKCIHSQTGICSHTLILIHTHVHTQTRPAHSLENGTLQDGVTAQIPEAAGASLAEPSEASGHRGACLWDAVRSRVLPFPCGRQVVRGPKRWAWPSRRAGQGTSSHQQTGP